MISLPDFGQTAGNSPYSTSNHPLEGLFFKIKNKKVIWPGTIVPGPTGTIVPVQKTFLFVTLKNNP